MKLCACSNKSANTGQPNCIGTRGATVGFVLIDTTDSNGTPNFIPAGQDMTDVYVSGKINETPDKRWNFIKGFKNVDQPVGDPTTEDFDGIAEKVEDGVETFTGVRPGGSGDPKFKAIIDSRECKDTSFWEITANGELVGELNNEGDLYPIKIQTGTLNARYIKPTNSTKQKLQLDFAVSKLVYTGSYKYISAGQFEKSLLTYTSLQDILSVTSNESTTGVTIKLNGCFGPLGEETPFTGLLIGDWVFNNVTDALPVVLLTAVEQGTTGIYDFTFSAQDTTDDMDYDFTKAGFELAVKPGAFKIP